MINPLHVEIPSDFWKNEKLVFELDSEKYFTQEDLANCKNLDIFFPNLIKRYKYQKCREFSNRNYWYFIKFLFISSNFLNLYPSKIIDFCGGVPLMLKIKCKCGSMLNGVRFLKGNFSVPEPFEKYSHEYYLRISKECPECESIICIYRAKVGIPSYMMLFFDFLNWEFKCNISNKQVLFGWMLLFTRALAIDYKSIERLYLKDIYKFMELVDNHPISEDDYVISLFKGFFIK